MTTLALPLTTDDDEFLGTIIAAHGDLDLISERLYPDLPAAESKLKVLSQYATLDKDRLAAAIHSALMIQTYESVTSLKLVVLSTLDELTPTSRAKLLVDLLQHLTALTAPPPVQNNSSSTNIINMMSNSADQVREALEKHVNLIDDQPPT